MTTRRLLLAAAASLLLALGVSAWTGWQALQGGRSLQLAAGQLEDARATLDTDSGDAVAVLRKTAQDTAAARHRFEDPLVRLVSALPWAGEPVQVATAVAISTDAAVRDALLPLAEAAGADPLQRLLPGSGTVDLAFAEHLSGPATSAAETLTAAQARLQASGSESGIGRLDDARMQLDGALQEVEQFVQGLAVATRFAPRLLGDDGTARYLVIPQNPAEARGTGGLIGGYLLVEAEDGRLRVVDSGVNSDLANVRLGTVSVADLGADYEEHYGYADPTKAWVNSNLSPHFPYAGQIWTGLWEQQTGEQLDGVIALDPVALSYLLEALGPVTAMDGTQVTPANVVDLTLRDAYARFDLDETGRDAFLQDVLSQTAEALFGQTPAPRPLLTGLSRAAEERRLLFWSPDAEVQDALGQSGLSGRLPEDDPGVGDTIVNSIASKLDYYLERDLTYAPACAGGPSRLTLELRNDAPASGLPDIVTFEQYRPGLPAGTNRSTVTLYVPLASRPGELRVDGEALPYRQGTEVGHRWIETLVTLEPGQDARIELDFVEERVAGKDVSRISQPLVRPETFTIQDCA